MSQQVASLQGFCFRFLPGVPALTFLVDGLGSGGVRKNKLFLFLAAFGQSVFIVAMKPEHQRLDFPVIWCLLPVEVWYSVKTLWSSGADHCSSGENFHEAEKVKLANQNRGHLLLPGGIISLNYFQCWKALLVIWNVFPKVPINCHTESRFDFVHSENAG